MQNKDSTFKFSRYFLILNIVVVIFIAVATQFVTTQFSDYYGIFSILLMIAATTLGLLDVTAEAKPVVNAHHELFILGGSIIAIYLAALIYAICVVVFQHRKRAKGFISHILSLVCVSGGLFTLYSVFVVTQIIYREGRLFFH